MFLFLCIDYVVEHIMNTNPGTGVNRNIPNSISNFFSSATNAITDGKALNYSIHTGAFNIPYATMGLVTIIAGTFTYVTYTDYKNDPGDDEEDDEEDEEEDEEEDDEEEEEEEEDEDDENDNLGMFNPLNYNSNKTEDEDTEKKEPEDAEKKEPENAEKKEPENAEKKDKEAPGEKYTLGGKTYSRKTKRTKRTKRKYTKRKSQR